MRAEAKCYVTWITTARRRDLPLSSTYTDRKPLVSARPRGIFSSGGQKRREERSRCESRHFLSFHWHGTRVATESSHISATPWNNNSNSWVQLHCGGCDATIKSVFPVVSPFVSFLDLIKNCASKVLKRRTRLAFCCKLKNINSKSTQTTGC